MGFHDEKCKIVHESAKLARITEIVIRGRELRTPSYFPSISSYGVKFSMRDTLYLLKFHKYPRLLISAYDLYNSEPEEQVSLMSTIEGYRDAGFYNVPYLESVLTIGVGEAISAVLLGYPLLCAIERSAFIATAEKTGSAKGRKSRCGYDGAERKWEPKH